MCFCAEASFAAAGILAITGLLTVRSTTKKSQRMLAVIPIIFALQQAAEGVLWVSAHNNQLLWLHTIAAYAFLFCAFVIWPTWIPWALNTYEEYKKPVLTYLTYWGIVVSSALMVLMLVSHMTITTHEHHVQYLFMLPEWVGILGTFLYAIPIITPFFVCGKKYCIIMGILLIVSAIITWLMWYNYFASVWCFFSALLSILIFCIITHENEEHKQ